jgi:transcription elongation factor SPT5
MQNRIRQESSSTLDLKILSAFTRDAIQGFIYVEAASFLAVVEGLQGIPGVARTPGGGSFLIDLVDVQDRPLLLNMDLNGLPSSIKFSSWVRIKGGIHKGDLALVCGVDNPSLVCEVYVVPRLAYDAKRKRGQRPPQALFDVERAQRAFKSKAEVRNQAFLFRGKFYLRGLLMAEYHISRLTSEGVNATEAELQPFRQLSEWDSAEEFISPIRVGDNVRVVSGAFKGGWGTTMEIKDVSVCLFWKGDAQDVREILTRDIRKFFRLGDFVQVLYGPNRGVQGFIVHLDAELVVLYIHKVSDEHLKSTGLEVRGHF